MRFNAARTCRHGDDDCHCQSRSRDVVLRQVPVDDVTLPARRQFADIKLSDSELRDLVSDSRRHYVYAVTSRQVRPSVCPSVRLSVRPSVCLSVCLSALFT